VTAIIFDPLDVEVMHAAKQTALEYALTSTPFTFNRMGLPLRRRVENIAKGKFAESVVVSVLQRGGLAIDVDSCQTTFWSRDRRDFVLGDHEWDVKSLFLHALPPRRNFDECLALIPNNSSSDQWATRELRYVPTAVAGPCYLFVFFGPVTVEIDLDERQEAFLRTLCTRYHERESPSEPFDREWFLGEFPNLDNVLMRLSDNPIMAITGVASSREWDRFHARPAGRVLVDGVPIFETKIENMACRAGDLPPFSSIANWTP